MCACTTRRGPGRKALGRQATPMAWPDSQLAKKTAKWPNGASSLFQGRRKLCIEGSNKACRHPSCETGSWSLEQRCPSRSLVCWR